ncbi:hypothetical protein DPMN_148777 [Dreissena polymorpha]|uniref:Uncharacterized protein n=1 Tax=Dreissena polymorpha TaxID=45954 RepID=A0A9D4J466_DREPO|nr:hypothetical protein DPMN_148777 [Dreissena polymorpha]
MNRGSTGNVLDEPGTPPAFTGGPPGRYRLRPGLDRGTTGYYGDSPGRHRHKP